MTSGVITTAPTHQWLSTRNIYYSQFNVVGRWALVHTVIQGRIWTRVRQAGCSSQVPNLRE